MLKPRIIPALLLSNKGVYKTVNFESKKYIGDPLNIIKIFNDKFADEIMIFDIDSTKNKKIDFEYLKNIFHSCRMPVCYSGGVDSLKTAEKIFILGVEKIGLGNCLLTNKSVIRDIAKEFGSQSTVAIFNLVEKSKKIYIFDYLNNQIKEDINVIEEIKKVQDLNIGEIVLHFVNKDGSMQGYDYFIINELLAYIKTPLTLLGGLQDLNEIIKIKKDYNYIGIAGSSFFIYKGKFKSVLISYPSNFFKE